MGKKTKCAVCGKLHEYASMICFTCESTIVKGQIVVAEVGLFKIRTGRCFIVSQDSMKEANPDHTFDRVYHMRKVDFRRNIKNLGLNPIHVEA